MTPYAHHTNDAYLAAYGAELAEDLTAAHTTRRTRFGLRRSIAQSFVRIGAWLLPEKPELAEGQILVLEIDPTVRATQRAA